VSPINISQNAGVSIDDQSLSIDSAAFDLIEEHWQVDNHASGHIQLGAGLDDAAWKLAQLIRLAVTYCSVASVRTAAPDNRWLGRRGACQVRDELALPLRTVLTTDHDRE
jgi:hypothetical protein